MKLIAGYGDPLVGRLLTFDAQTTKFSEVKARRDPGCPVCGEEAAAAEGRKLRAVEPPTAAAS